LTFLINRGSTVVGDPPQAMVGGAHPTDDPHAVVGGAPLLAYAHHGSLSRQIRLEVERQLKAGKLKAILATGSLELGIDIGALDEVILVQAPWSVSEAVQRIGRAGHNVGRRSRGTFLSAHIADTACAAVVARAVLDGEIEAVQPPQAPRAVGWKAASTCPRPPPRSPPERPARPAVPLSSAGGARVPAWATGFAWSIPNRPKIPWRAKSSIKSGCGCCWTATASSFANC
jgi:hypothetical protein